MVFSALDIAPVTSRFRDFVVGERNRVLQFAVDPDLERMEAGVVIGQHQMALGRRKVDERLPGPGTGVQL